jgi:hypothetical protein
MAQAKSDTPEARLKTLMAALRKQGVTDRPSASRSSSA